MVEWLRSRSSSFRKVVHTFIPKSNRRDRGRYFEIVHYIEERLAMKFIEALNASSCKDRDNVGTSIDREPIEHWKQ